jgi:catechol 2,3-dioxygenase-like lactoylglutathione lyase family enzyme
MTETLPPLGIQRVKVVAVSVTDLDRANCFYKEKLGLEPAFEGKEQVGWWLG